MMDLLPRQLLLALPIVVALGLCGVTLADAYTAAAPSLREAAARRIPTAAVPRPTPTAPVAVVERALDRDPFHPERRRADQPYQLGPAPVAAVAAAFAPAAPRAPMVTLVGIAAYGNGKGMAALAVQGRPPQLVRVGGAFEGFRLTRVTPSEATLVSPDTTLVLRSAGAAHLPTQP